MLRQVVILSFRNLEQPTSRGTKSGPCRSFLPLEKRLCPPFFGSLLGRTLPLLAVSWNIQFLLLLTPLFSAVVRLMPSPFLFDFPSAINMQHCLLQRSLRCFSLFPSPSTASDIPGLIPPCRLPVSNVCYLVFFPRALHGLYAPLLFLLLFFDRSEKGQGVLFGIPDVLESRCPDG